VRAFNHDTDTDTDTDTDADADADTNANSNADSDPFDANANSDTYTYPYTDPNPRSNADTRLWQYGLFVAAKRQYALRGSFGSTQQRSGHLSLRGNDSRRRLAPGVDRLRSQRDPGQRNDHGGESLDVPVAVARRFRRGLVEQSLGRLG
jgi:hypothetical protein